jgi:dienelactone hydrolase
MPIAFSWLAIAAFSYGQTSTLPTSPGLEAPSALWGDLQPGTYGTGFRTVFQYDNSRTWKSTRSYDGTFSPDANGRPIQINIWYPARASSSDKKMRFADYEEQSAPEKFATINSVMKQRSRDDAAGSVPHSKISELLTIELNAYRDAQPVAGRFPVVLYFGGLSAPINDNVILAEYLASHGYVVASVSLIGPSEETTFQSRTSDDIEASVRDMEFAWSVLQDEPDVDKTKLAIMGHSVGAIEAVVLGMRNANVSAVIGLDGTYGFEGLSTVLTHTYGYDPGKMKAAFLDLRRAQGAQGNEALDLRAVESFRHADRTFITIGKMHHSDFTSFAMVGEYFHTPLPTGYALNSWTRQSGRSGYEQVCRIVLSTLDTRTKSNPEATAALDGEKATLDPKVQETNAVTLKHESAVPAPPSPQEAAALVDSRGLDAAKSAFVTGCGQDALAYCVNRDRFNTWGYNLLGQQRGKDALAVFELNAWAHPQNANTQDSLADGYTAVGDNENARKAVEHAIALAPGDSSLDAPARSSFLSEENAKLKQFK